jgi:predicted amidohydrolase
MKIAVCQIEIALLDLAENRRKILSRFTEAAANGAQLVVFPECALSGYLLESHREAAAAAVEATPHAWPGLLDACESTGVWCIVGFVERDGDRLYNTAAVFGPGDLIAKYRKMHLPVLGVDRFVEPGNLGFPVFDLPIGRIGLNICYDQRFPESARIAMLNGAQIIVVPTNEPETARDVCSILTRARAFENRVFYVWANRTGSEREANYMGKSQIVDPHGLVLACAGQSNEETLYAQIDPGLADAKRTVVQSGRYEIDLLHHRRPKWYNTLVGESDRYPEEE